MSNLKILFAEEEYDNPMKQPLVLDETISARTKKIIAKVSLRSK